MKLGKKLKDGEMLPPGSVYIRYLDSGQINVWKIDSADKYHEARRSEAYELLDFEFPEKPKDPEPEKPKDPEPEEYWTFYWRDRERPILGRVYIDYTFRRMRSLGTGSIYSLDEITLLDRFAKVE